MGGFSSDSFSQDAFDPNAFGFEANTSFDPNAFSGGALDPNAFSGVQTPPPVGSPVAGYPLCIATEGYISGINTLAVATNGYICPTIIVFAPPDEGGSGTVRAVEVEGYKLTSAQIEQLRREDEEVVAIITVIGEHLL